MILTKEQQAILDGEHGEKLPLHFKVLNERLEVFVSEQNWTYDED